MRAGSYIITWTTYATWKYDEFRVNARHSQMASRPASASVAGPDAADMDPVVLNVEQQRAVEDAIRRRCLLRQWTLHAVKVRSNHVFVVVTANGEAAEVLSDLKVWSARRLSEEHGPDQKKRWWTDFGETTEIPDGNYLNHAIRYVNQG
jgi:REP element-mobilizing transposase RayT